jgi:hypothetical protein
MLVVDVDTFVPRGVTRPTLHRRLLVQSLAPKASPWLLDRRHFFVQPA